jgi:hypothetical protein
LNTILPAPDVELPDKNFISPLVPALACPVLNDRPPDVEKPVPVAIDISPLVPWSLRPPNIITAPPVEDVDAPALI